MHEGNLVGRCQSGCSQPVRKTRLSVRVILVAVMAAAYVAAAYVAPAYVAPAPAYVGSGVFTSRDRPSPNSPDELSAHAFQSILNGTVYLSCGPNDGELLNGISRLRLETNYMRSGHVLLFAGSRVVAFADFAGPSSLATVRTIYCLFDTTQIENSRVELTFVLFTPNYTRVLAFDRCGVTIQNPHFEALPATAGLTPLAIQGRPEDTYYQLAVGSRTDLLKWVPNGISATPGTQLVARGNWAKSTTSPKTRRIVTDLDILFGIHGLNTQLVLWTYNSEQGWARSTVKRIRDLVPGYGFPTTYSNSLQQALGGTGS